MKIHFGLRALMILFVCLFVLGAIAIPVRAMSEDETSSLSCSPNPVVLGQKVTATFKTNAKDILLNTVQFLWFDPKGHLDHKDAAVKLQNGLAISRFTPNEVGKWTVKVRFLEVNLCEREFELEVIKTPLFVIPEVPFGSVAMLSGMFCALGLFVLKRKNQPV